MKAKILILLTIGMSMAPAAFAVESNGNSDYTAGSTDCVRNEKILPGTSGSGSSSGQGSASGAT